MWSAPLDLSLQSLNDLYQIKHVVYRYAFLQDAGQPERFDEVFAPEMVFKSAAGEFTLEEWREKSRGWRDRLDATQHFKTNVSVTVDGDKATARFYVLAQHAVNALAPEPFLMVGSNVQDDLRRIDGQWKIVARQATRIWIDGNPRVLGLDQPVAAHHRVPVLS